VEGPSGQEAGDAQAPADQRRIPLDRRPTSRPLTPGEVALARSVFGDAIDLDRVRLVRRKWWPFHPKGTVMAPTGNIHFHPSDTRWSEDFSRESLELQGLLVHELTHVWQAQARGRFYLPLMRHPFCRYAYRFKPGRAFDRYGLEQQAEIVRHVFLLRRAPHWPVATDLAELEAILPFGRA
jgi:hypothetical protein